MIKKSYLLYIFFIFIFFQNQIASLVGRDNIVGLFVRNLDNVIILFLCIILLRFNGIRMNSIIKKITFLFFSWIIIGLLGMLWKPTTLYVSLFCTIFSINFFIIYISYSIHSSFLDINKVLTFLKRYFIFIAILGIINILFPIQFNSFRTLLGLRNVLGDMRFGLYPLVSIFHFIWDAAFIYGLYAIYCFAFFITYPKKKILYFSCFIISSLCTLMTLRLGENLAIPFCIFTLIMVEHFIGKRNFPLMKNKIRKIRAVFVSFILSILFLWINIDVNIKREVIWNFDNYYSSFTGNESTIRGDLFKGGMDVALDYFPFGMGFGQFASRGSSLFLLNTIDNHRGYITEYIPQTKPHLLGDSGIATILSETGFIGFIIILLTLTLIQFQNIKIYKWSLQNNDNYLLIRALSLGAISTTPLILFSLIKAAYIFNIFFAMCTFGLNGLIVCYYYNLKSSELKDFNNYNTIN